MSDSESEKPNLIPRPPAEDDHEGKGHKPIPYTGWDGPVPSKDGGSGEEDYINKPPYHWTSKEFKMKYVSMCFCESVAFELHGDPLDAKHCHCRQCQRLHGAPFQWAALYPKTSVRIIKNENNALHFFSTATQDDDHHVPCKVSCDQCRSPLFDEGRGMVMVYPSSIRFEDNHIPSEFQPTAHIFYESRVIDIPDGIPKYAGHKGDSELIAEADPDKEGTMPKYKNDNKKRKIA